MLKSLYNSFEITRLIEREERYLKSVRVRDIQLKVLRCLVYAVLFGLVLASAVVSKCSLLLITRQVGHEPLKNGLPPEVINLSSSSFIFPGMPLEISRPKDAAGLSKPKWVWILLLTTCASYVFAFFTCLVKVLLRHFLSPSPLVLFAAVVFESLNAVGTGIFVFGVLPDLDMARAVLIMNVLSIVPAFLKLLADFSVKDDDSSSRSDKFSRSFVFNALSLLMQTSAIVIVLVSKYSLVGRLPNWELALAVLLVSFSTSRCFYAAKAASLDFSKFQSNGFASRLNKMLVDLSKFNRRLDKSRFKTGLLTNLIKIGITVLFAYIYHPCFIADTGLFGRPTTPPPNRYPLPVYVFQSSASPATTSATTSSSLSPTTPESSSSEFTTSALNQSIQQAVNRSLLAIDLNRRAEPASSTTWTDEMIILFAVQVVSTLACAFFSSLAFKMRMHRISFSVPMALVTPVCLAIAVSLSHFHFERPESHFLELFAFPIKYSYDPYLWHLACGICLWFLSHLWTNNHIWLGVIKKKDFRYQNVNGVFVENTLMISCRQPRTIMTTFGSEQDEEEPEKPAEKSEPLKPTVYICATLWHENSNEMLQLLTSIMRVDMDRREKLEAADESRQYECETHVFVDDAIETDESGARPNRFVRCFLELIDSAATFAHKRTMQLAVPEKTETPYGGRITYSLPCGSLLVVHMKDKAKIRIKKRWSQILYMYYLLGFKYFGSFEEMESLYSYNDEDYSQMARMNNNVLKDADFIGYGSLLRRIDKTLREKLENTFILALDGDVEFRADAMMLMVEKMRENKKIGAVCGRVHPIGSGPIVWYQYFEYAVGHWLQKVTENIFGSVMCSPGCFSLLRASTILEDHVLSIYSIKSTEASHYVQYDQGEDRWLSTLIVQQGYYIAYCSAAVSKTFAPETFNEYYNQRRRWIPSTMANLLDFLKDYRHILKTNSRISLLYVVYTFISFIASVLGPATVNLMIIDSLQTTFDFNIWVAYLVPLSLALAYVIVCSCSTIKNDTQITIGAALSVVYAFFMILVIVGAINRSSNSSPLNPSTLIIYILIFIFITAALIHPHEFKCLVPGVLYFLSLPSAFVLMNIYALFNLNNVSWGTREIKTTTQSGATPAAEKKPPSFGLGRLLGDSSSRDQCQNSEPLMRKIIDSLSSLEKKIESLSVAGVNGKTLVLAPSAELLEALNIKVIDDRCEPDKTTNSWIDDECLEKAKLSKLDEDEERFFSVLIEKVLLPVVYSSQHKQEMTEDLKSLRNSCCLVFCLLNAIWLLLMFCLQVIKDKLAEKVYIILQMSDVETLEFEPTSFVFIMLFVIILCVQFLSMLWHRLSTLFQLLKRTKVRSSGGASRKSPAKVNGHANHGFDVKNEAEQ